MNGYFDYNMAEIFAPMQIMIVLALALILFGPKRLPELGKQIGTALRDFNKAKNDMMKHLTLDHEPDHTYQPPLDESYYNTYDPSHYKAPPDLTDYTMVANPPMVTPAEGAIAHGTVTNLEVSNPSEMNDYTMAPSTVLAEHKVETPPAAEKKLVGATEHASV